MSGRRFPSLMMAKRNLGRNRLRSALAVLGIVIGVLAIASLGVFGTTLQIAAVGQLGDIGNEVQVSPSFEAGETEIDQRTADRIERVSGDAEVVRFTQGQASVTHGGEAVGATVYGTGSPGILYDAQAGTVPERHSNGAVVGADIADRLDLRVGNTITVDGTTYRIIGVLESQDAFSPIFADSAVFLPEDDVGGDGYSDMVIRAESNEDAAAVADRIREEINDREELVSVTELQEIAEDIDEFFGILNQFLIAIGGISLVVAAVAILNVMLMSVVERRQEIGVFRAVGLHKRQVLRILLAEATMLGVVGSVIGIALALAVGVGINVFILDDPTAIIDPRNAFYLGLSLVVGAAVSTLSGLYPAWKAANQRPVETLRD